jgi:hypothetical protein
MTAYCVIYHIWVSPREICGLNITVNMWHIHFGHLDIFQQRFFMEKMCFSHSLLLQHFFSCLGWKFTWFSVIPFSKYQKLKTLTNFSLNKFFSFNR